MTKRRLLAYLIFVVGMTITFLVIFGTRQLMNGWDRPSGHSVIQQIKDF